MDNDHGDAPVTHISRGVKTAKVRVPVTDHDLATIEQMLPLTGYFSGGGTRVQFVPSIGTDMSTLAKKLVLKKMVNGAATTDETLWITAPKACPMGAFKMTLGAKQSTYTVEFQLYPDTANGDRCLFFGDETAS